MAEEEDGDLYGDLEDGKIAAVTTTSSNNKVTGGTMTMMAASKASSSSLKSPPGSSMAKLEEKIKALEAENLTLKRNMGMLYRTARREIDRKDKQISELMSELDKSKS